LRKRAINLGFVARIGLAIVFGRATSVPGITVPVARGLGSLSLERLEFQPRIWGSACRGVEWLELQGICKGLGGHSSDALPRWPGLVKTGALACPRAEGSRSCRLVSLLARPALRQRGVREDLYSLVVRVQRPRCGVLARERDRVRPGRGWRRSRFRERLFELTSRRTVPQILIDDNPIGGTTNSAYSREADDSSRSLPRRGRTSSMGIVASDVGLDSPLPCLACESEGVSLSRELAPPEPTSASKAVDRSGLLATLPVGS
jgi:hypothetical protein